MTTKSYEQMRIALQFGEVALLAVIAIHLSSGLVTGAIESAAIALYYVIGAVASVAMAVVWFSEREIA